MDNLEFDDSTLVELPHLPRNKIGRIGKLYRIG